MFVSLTARASSQVLASSTASKIGSNVAGVVGILERVKAEVEHRQQFIAELNSQDGKMGPRLLT